MKKKVNGKVVDIKNIDIFEKAAEGMAIQKAASSTIRNRLTVESDLINDCIKRYEAFYKALPFPLYALESNAKYAAIGEFINESLESKLEMWADNALFISLGNNLALQIIGDTWGVIECANKCEKEISLEDFTSEIGYEEYKWILDRIISKQSIGEFYMEFMEEFIKACNNDPLIMKWELGNILTFGNVTSKINLKHNTIINLESKSEFIIDIFYAGNKKTDEKEYVLSTANPGSGFALRPKYVKYYDFDAYEKLKGDNVTVKGSDKLQKNKLRGLYSLFQILYTIKLANEQSEFEDFTGFISDTDLVFCINKRVFVCKAYKESEIKEVARNVEIYGYDRGIVYLSKSTQIARGLYKEYIYSYSIKDGTSRLCKIQFSTT